jgi:hypothetical protein
MCEAGWPATGDTFKNARRRGEVPIGHIATLTPEDERFVSWALDRWPEWDVEALARPGAKAAAHIAELRCRCQTSYPIIGRMTPQERSNSGQASDTPQHTDNVDENKIGVILPGKHNKPSRQERSQPFLKSGSESG